MSRSGASGSGGQPASQGVAAFFSTLFGRRERFSLEELAHLYDGLSRVNVITEQNKETVIETLRSIAELMIWGDQHEPAFFDFFLENHMMSQFLRILSLRSAVRGGVAVQLLQTLSIMIQNIASDTAIYYLFSKSAINAIITHRFDFADEEVLAYYISLLKTISMKLNVDTVQFFLFARSAPHRAVTGPGDSPPEPACPLYSEAVKFAAHGESMVRAAVRTLTLNLFSVPDAALLRFMMDDPEARAYLPHVGDTLREHCIAVDALTDAAAHARAVAGGGAATTASSKLSERAAELGDVLCYANDVLAVAAPPLSCRLAGVILTRLVDDTLLPPLRGGGSGPGSRDDTGPGSSQGQGDDLGGGWPPTLGPAVTLYCTARLVAAITSPHVAAAVAAAFLAPPSVAAAARRAALCPPPPPPAWEAWAMAAGNPSPPGGGGGFSRTASGALASPSDGGDVSPGPRSLILGAVCGASGASQQAAAIALLSAVASNPSLPGGLLSTLGLCPSSHGDGLPAPTPTPAVGSAPLVAAVAGLFTWGSGAAAAAERETLAAAESASRDVITALTGVVLTTGPLPAAGTTHAAAALLMRLLPMGGRGGVARGWHFLPTRSGHCPPVPHPPQQRSVGSSTARGVTPSPR